jgi:hypothetical protein
MDGNETSRKTKNLSPSLTPTEVDYGLLMLFIDSSSSLVLSDDTGVPQAHSQLLTIGIVPTRWLKVSVYWFVMIAHYLVQHCLQRARKARCLLPLSCT